jgi:hypothetical protein
MTVTLLTIAIVLLIVFLVVRDQTEFKLGRMRAELMALRSEEKGLSQECTEVQRLVAQIGEALLRAERRQVSAEQTRDELKTYLEEMDVQVQEEQSQDAAQPQEQLPVIAQAQEHSQTTQEQEHPQA